MELKEYINLCYNNFKDEGRFEDLTNDELSSYVLFNIKNLTNKIIYNIRKRNYDSKNEDLKDLFKMSSILAKINNINLEE